jgi:hypothetical protein
MPGRSAVALLAAATLVAACGGSHTAPVAQRRGASPQTHAAATPPAASARVVAYPARLGGYRLVNKNEHPVPATTKDLRFPRSFSFAKTARDGYYLPGRHSRQDLYLIAGQLTPGVSPAAAIEDYLGEFSGQELHLTAEPPGPLGGTVKCWESGGFTFCMWADNGTYGVLDYRPPFGLDTVLIHHLAGLVPRFRRLIERAA